MEIEPEKLAKPPIHTIKLNSSSHCDAIAAGQCSCVILENDAQFQKGDCLVIELFKSSGILRQAHPISTQLYRIDYVLSGGGLKEGFVGLSISRVTDAQIHGILSLNGDAR